MSKKKHKKLRATVEKVIKESFPKKTEKAQIEVHEADELYREIRVENTLMGENGVQVQLKPGAEVDVIVEAGSDAVLKEDEDTSEPDKNKNKKK